MTNEQLTAALASLALDREIEAAMAPGDFVAAGAVEAPGRAYVGPVLDAILETPLLRDDAIGLARARNRWAALIRVAEAAGRLQKAQRDADDYANASEGDFDVFELQRPINVASAELDAALAALGEGEEATE